MKNTIIVSIILLIFISTASGCTGNDPKPDGDTAVSQSKIYEETTDSSHEVSIYQLAFTDVDEETDNVVTEINNAGFRFECYGFDKNQKLYVFMDGNIDNALGVFDLSKEDKRFYYNTINIKKREASAGSHIIQFVQFDGADVIFCKTKHIEIVSRTAG